MSATFDAALAAAGAEAERARQDMLIDQLTAWHSVAEMVADAVKCGENGYRPTCRVDLDSRYAEVADIYDAEMARIGWKKRAYRPTYGPGRVVPVCVDANCVAETENDDELLCRRHRLAARRMLKGAA